MKMRNKNRKNTKSTSFILDTLPYLYNSLYHFYLYVRTKNFYLFWYIF